MAPTKAPSCGSGTSPSASGSFVPGAPPNYVDTRICMCHCEF